MSLITSRKYQSLWAFFYDSVESRQFWHCWQTTCRNSRKWANLLTMQTEEYEEESLKTLFFYVWAPNQTKQNKVYSGYFLLVSWNYAKECLALFFVLEEPKWIYFLICHFSVLEESKTNAFSARLNINNCIYTCPVYKYVCMFTYCTYIYSTSIYIYVYPWNTCLLVCRDFKIVFKAPFCTFLPLECSGKKAAWRVEGLGFEHYCV